MSGRPDNSLQHGFQSHAEDSAFYPAIKTHGNPPGWWGYGHWRDDFSNDDPEQTLAEGVRFDKGPGRGGPGFSDGSEMGKPAGGKDHKGGGEKKPTVRKNFADTAFWAPVSVTGEDGEAEFEFVFPDSLTSWKANAVAPGNGRTARTTSGAGRLRSRQTSRDPRSDGTVPRLHAVAGCLQTPGCI